MNETPLPSEDHPVKNGRARIARNIAYNWLGMSCEAVVGFLLLPLLVGRLGETAYGLWIVIGSFTGFFLLLDLGLRGSVGRFIAHYRAQNDFESINGVICTALVLLTGLGVIAACIVALGSSVVPHLIDIPPDLTTDVRWSLYLVAINLGLWFSLQAFDAILWGFQRFDTLNGIDVPAACIRLALCYSMVGTNGGLVTLAAITLGMTASVGAVKSWQAFAQDRRLRLGWRFVELRSAHELFGYGVWAFLANASALVKKSLIPIAIGAVISPAAVTLYAIARRLVDYVGMFLMASTGVLTPVAAEIHSQGDDARQRRLFMIGSTYFNCFVLYLTAGLAALGGSFIRLWVGPEYELAGSLLLILLAGELVGLTNYVARSVLLGAAKHQLMAWLAIIEAIVAVGGVVVGAYLYGMTGAVVAMAMSTFLFTGVILTAYTCRVLHMSLKEFLISCWGPALGAAITPTAILGALVAYSRPDNWPTFILYGVTFTAAWIASGCCFFAELRVSPRQWKAVLRGS